MHALQVRAIGQTPTTDVIDSLDYGVSISVRSCPDALFLPLPLPYPLRRLQYSLPRPALPANSSPFPSSLARFVSFVPLVPSPPHPSRESRCCVCTSNAARRQRFTETTSTLYSWNDEVRRPNHSNQTPYLAPPPNPPVFSHETSHTLRRSRRLNRILGSLSASSLSRQCSARFFNVQAFFCGYHPFAGCWPMVTGPDRACAITTLIPLSLL
ncbi:hypothetical protein EJ06DRAFT_210799 [Trichodelitschia bisporula]|uniref:Uncharacterized protein n=1 Tax=Trichodelitschia bisporula TaxID=703511 RepID=A0A6G1I8Q9_9PEZI|nr:hypothetical protein EJ06DRAFT_210799 [Trichodelitschia bisporula]